MDDVRDQTSEVLALLKADDVFTKTKVPDLYAETLAFIDAHRTYRSELDRLSRSIKAREESDHDAAVRRGVVEGAKKHGLDEKEENDPSFGKFFKDALSSTITGVQTYAEEEKRLKQLHDQDKEGKLAAIEGNYSRAGSDFIARVRALTGVFNKSLGIPETEFGLDQLLDDISVYKQGDAAVVVKAKQSWAKMRPNDPLLAGAVLTDAAQNQHESLAECVKLAEKCRAGLDTIPDSRVLRYARYTLLSYAAFAVETYFDNAYPLAKPWGAVRNEAALTAAAYRKQAAEAYVDRTGGDTVSLAWDYFWAGQFDNALLYAKAAQSAPRFQKDAGFCLKMAELHSLLSKPDDSLLWLTSLVTGFGYNDTDALYANPDLAALRSAKPEEFDALLKVAFTWKVDFGFLNDDILLTNNSRFAITSVRLRPHITSGTRVWDLDLRVERVDAGETYKWVNVLSVPGSTIDNGRAELSCDQCRASR